MHTRIFHTLWLHRIKKDGKRWCKEIFQESGEVVEFQGRKEVDEEDWASGKTIYT